MMSTPCGTTIEGMSDTAISPTPARSGIRAVSTTWSTMIARRAVAPTMRNASSALTVIGADPRLMSWNASARASGTSRAVAGVGINQSRAVSRKNTKVRKSAHSRISIRLTTSARRPIRRPK